MSIEKQTNVMSKCRNFLKYMNLGVETKLRILHWEIPYYVSCTIASIPIIVLIILDYWTAYDIGLSNFQENGNVFFISLGTTQLQFIYICLTSSNGLIVQTIKHMQKTINRRKFINIIILDFQLYESMLLFYVHLLI